MNSELANEIEPKWDFWRAMDALDTGRVMIEPHRDVPKGLPFQVMSWRDPCYGAWTDDSDVWHPDRQLRAVCLVNYSPQIAIISRKLNPTPAMWDEAIAKCAEVFARWNSNRWAKKCPLCDKAVESAHMKGHIEKYCQTDIDVDGRTPDHDQAWEVGKVGALRVRLAGMKPAPKSRKGKGRKAVAK